MPKQLKISPVQGLQGEISLPGDKSISHRAIMLSSLAKGENIIHNFLQSEDCIATANCFREMGIQIKFDGDKAFVVGKGLRGLSRPSKMLEVGNSGTTIRLLSGILAGQKFESQITGDSSIQKRPMKRIIEPLTLMGAKITGKKGTKDETFPPLIINTANLKGLEYNLKVASAQVKSAILLAGLYANGQTTVIEPVQTRDHTERMFGFFGINLTRFNRELSIEAPNDFAGREIFVPGDISSAAYFIVAALIVQNSNITIKNIGTNPTRTGLLQALKKMGAQIELADEEVLSGEPRATIKVGKQIVAAQNLAPSASLIGIDISGEIIPNILDEIPILAVLATQAEGPTVIKDAGELRVKESDRIKTTVSELKKMGADIEEREDGMVIHGPTKLKGAKIQSYGDHRIAMSTAIAGLIAEGETIIEDTACIETSFPGFEAQIQQLITNKTSFNS
ncbi:3-phosphoshikimate 1-carboxyvinyltransferase [candidate division WOR-1 bacterium RIFOXYC2_FULL_37_10]|uniref:3-phosphoshikimate 1-carboxyvinyltransferase n=1 Tax=candidate division WOR-1 bacterium RIFOXYB2_FULL_37_13 TaxID=1802579 RepID=A0A1F4SEH7_UNCSA|nr:MAG: 3-phosphoshikimate 1-carboxyvinyltransferase [candidate division WOR-1 bacterium RIFOXYA2_FULL_37_7]OGC18821.1 MAG: 3-phosphoshikimate 1-carboxyvinyltransferase [candidate division WOR-1 bacterium RIFOXYB2_FULL_37_13]OGC32524.1 MAG: 3-phosphoshikimate 1-carboxyvinyltransferase [candidate division WOR-1 bacterium RIFOXYC2_FULL_37_10]